MSVKLVEQQEAYPASETSIILHQLPKSSVLEHDQMWTNFIFEYLKNLSSLFYSSYFIVEADGTQ